MKCTNSKVVGHGDVVSCGEHEYGKDSPIWYCEKHAGLRWTIEKPTVPGWYWMQVSPHDPEIIQVVRGPRDDPDQLYAHFRTANNKTFDGPLVVLDGQFAGPIPEPLE